MRAIKRSKLFIVGDSQVGKTTILTRLFEDHEVIPVSATEQVTEYCVTVYPLEIELTVLEIRNYVFFVENEIEVDSETDFAIFCYAIDDPDSYQHVVDMWIPIFEEFVSDRMDMGLIGNKNDLRHAEMIHNLAERELQHVSTEQGTELFDLYDTVQFFVELGIDDIQMVQQLLEYII